GSYERVIAALSSRASRARRASGTRSGPRSRASNILVDLDASEVERVLPSGHAAMATPAYRRSALRTSATCVSVAAAPSTRTTRQCFAKAKLRPYFEDKRWRASLFGRSRHAPRSRTGVEVAQFGQV